MTTWVDFKAVKEAARFEDILERYGLSGERKGNEILLRCPFHEEVKPSCRVNVERSIFHCFGCGAKGNALDFVAKKEDISIKKAAELVGEWFGIAPGEKAASKKRSGVKKGAEEKPSALPATATVVPDAQVGLSAGQAGNKPLSFSLQLDAKHPYLAERGLSEDTIATFGLGFCAKGVMKGRIAIPIRDEQDRLVGYAGRWPGPPPEGEERYRLPTGFKKSEVLFNLHRVAGAEHLVVVEGFFQVFRLHELHVPSVALMGTALSPSQEKLIVGSGTKRVTLLLDGNDAGRACAAAIAPRLARHLFVRIADLPDGAQPDTIAEEALARCPRKG